MTGYLIKLLVVYPMMVGLITLELILFAVILYYANHEGGQKRLTCIFGQNMHVRDNISNPTRSGK